MRSHLPTVLNVGESKVRKVSYQVQIVDASKNLVLFHLKFQQLTLILLLHPPIQMILSLLLMLSKLNHSL